MSLYELFHRNREPSRKNENNLVPRAFSLILREKALGTRLEWKINHEHSLPVLIFGRCSILALNFKQQIADGGPSVI